MKADEGGMWGEIIRRCNRQCGSPLKSVCFAGFWPPLLVGGDASKGGFLSFVLVLASPPPVACVYSVLAADMLVESKVIYLTVKTGPA